MKVSTSAGIAIEAEAVIPDGVTSSRRAVEPPLSIVSGSGARVTDADGNVFIDYVGGAGAVPLGHAHPGVAEAVARALRDGTTFGLGVTREEVELAARLVEEFPSADMVTFANSGTEANLVAARIARATTGRDTIVTLAECYHGHERLGTTRQARYNDPDSVTAALATGGVAAVILEPVAHNCCGTIEPAYGFLEAVRESCDTHGALLIFDEVMSWRHAAGGYQALAGVRPDITTTGKGLANGLPIGVVAGRRKPMSALVSGPRATMHFGTFNGNRASVAAALATLRAFEDGTARARMNSLGEDLREGLRALVQDAGIAAAVTGYGSVFSLVPLVEAGELRSVRDVARIDDGLLAGYRLELRKRGVLEKPDRDGLRGHVSAAHTPAHVELSLSAARSALRAALDARSIQHGLGAAEATD